MPCSRRGAGLPGEVGVESAAVGLAEMIAQLRAELAEAMRVGAGQQLRFGVGPVELDLEVEVTREVGGDGGVRFWVVSVGGKAGRSSGRTQRLKVTLEPVGADGKQVAVADVPGGCPK